MKRKPMTPQQRARILQENNYRCAYCGDPANCVDHIVPYAYDPHNKDKNLVAACSICNAIAGSQIFENFIAKQSYILEERKSLKWRRRIANQEQIVMPHIEPPKSKPPKQKKERVRKPPKSKEPKSPRPPREPRILEKAKPFISKRLPPNDVIQARLLGRLQSGEYCMHELFLFQHLMNGGKVLKAYMPPPWMELYDSPIAFLRSMIK